MEAIHTVVPRALTELFRNGPMSQGKLEVAWRVAVGDALSRVSTVKLQADGSVHVHPADQRWHKELKRVVADDSRKAEHASRRQRGRPDLS